MAIRNEHAVLNHLIESCRDGERGFRLAADRVAEASLKRAFGELADQRAGFARELLPHAQRLGGDAPAEGTRAAALHRRWIDIKDAVLHSDAAIVTEVQRGNAITVNAYVDALGGLLPPESRDIIQRQYEALLEADARLPGLASQH